MKQRLLNELKSNGFDCLNASLQKTCCGTSIVFSMTNLEANQKPITINGVSVLMDDETQIRAESLTLLVESGELNMHDEIGSDCCG